MNNYWKQINRIFIAIFLISMIYGYLVESKELLWFSAIAFASYASGMFMAWVDGGYYDRG